MAHKVLIPLDGSEFSRRILSHVCSFLNPGDNELILLRVAEPPKGIIGGPARPVADTSGMVPMYESVRDVEFERHPIYTTQIEDTLRISLEDELQADVLRLQDAGYDVSVAIRFGEPAHEIVAFVAEEGVDLVAMATHGRSGISQMLFGSIAEQTLRHLAVPVMLVRPFEEPAAMRAPGEVLAERLAGDQRVHLAVATDGSPFAQRATAVAGDLARALGADVLLLAAVREDAGIVRAREILNQAKTLLGDLESEPQSLSLTGYADEVIIQHLAKAPVDLLVIGAFGDRGATRFFIGSTAQRLVQHAPTSVLLVKGHRPALSNILACVALGDESVVTTAAQLARVLGANVRILHVISHSAARYMKLPEEIHIPLQAVLDTDTALARHMASCTSILEAAGFGQDAVRVRRGTLPDAIFDEARAGRFDLVVIGSQAGVGQGRFYMGSIADRIVKHAHQSVLVVRTTRQ